MSLKYVKSCENENTQNCGRIKKNIKEERKQYHTVYYLAFLNGICHTDNTKNFEWSVKVQGEILSAKKLKLSLL